ncbi:MAG: DNA polymerase III subunit delta' [Alphaproteobacteria bacterium]|nr:DNA polymerase III subunit delta' [Alphaproteobacteria bacterium]
MTGILGHERTRATLWAALKAGRPHHAYLLEGPRGLGKRLIADRYAMTANCLAESPFEALPCGTCTSCRQILAGTHPDVLLLEPDTERASRAIPIEAVREVIRKTTYHRFSARRRFVIVDPVEAMLEPAANALLKTLEEPPDGTGFLLVSHNPAALLPTIRSRCQRIRLGAVPVERVRDWLIADHGRDRELADAAARASLGCPGTALSLDPEGLQKRAGLRDDVLAALGGPLEGVMALAVRVTQGARQEWATEVAALLEVVEDLIRDGVLLATGARVPTTAPHPDLQRFAGLFPDGLDRCSRAVQDARDDLEVYVSGRTVVEALLTAVRRELAACPA